MNAEILNWFENVSSKETFSYYPEQRQWCCETRKVCNLILSMTFLTAHVVEKKDHLAGQILLEL